MGAIIFFLICMFIFPNIYWESGYIYWCTREEKKVIWESEYHRKEREYWSLRTKGLPVTKEETKLYGGKYNG